MKTKNNCKPPLLLSAKELARLLGIHRSSVFALRNSGRLPKPVRLGRSVRWILAEIQEWISAGTPPLAAWQWEGKK